MTPSTAEIWFEEHLNRFQSCNPNCAVGIADSGGTAPSRPLHSIGKPGAVSTHPSAGREGEMGIGGKYVGYRNGNTYL